MTQVQKQWSGEDGLGRQIQMDWVVNGRLIPWTLRWNYSVSSGLLRTILCPALTSTLCQELPIAADLISSGNVTAKVGVCTSWAPSYRVTWSCLYPGIKTVTDKTLFWSRCLLPHLDFHTQGRTALLPQHWRMVVFLVAPWTCTYFKKLSLYYNFFAIFYGDCWI